MKKFIITSVLLAMFAICSPIMGQDQQEEYLGLPGDNLNLYAVMKLFRESETLEGFEKNLNDENSRINNLDLNGDNFIDYIRVIDYIDGNVHNIVLQVAVDRKENQDLAVFTVERFSDGQVQIQLTGDEELYGRDYIIEPIFDEANFGQTRNPGYAGNTGRINGRNVNITRTTPVEIANWPVVRFIYLPSYVTWHSSWYWDYYPSYWHPWQPHYWHYYSGYHDNWYNDYYGNYRRWEHHRYHRWNDFYYSGRRSHSPNVNVRIQAGNYKTTYSHPDQRRDGEAMYAKTHPDKSNRRSENSSGNNTERRSVSKSTPDRNSTSSGNSTNRRSNTNVIDKSVKNRPSEQNTGTTRRSSSTVTKQNEDKTRTPGKSATTGGSSSNRRSSGSNESGTTERNGGKSKESETTKPSRRK